MWLSSNVIDIRARVKSNGNDSHIVLVEENDVRKLMVSASGEGNGDSSEPTGKRQNKKSNSTEEEEERKTLAQQVADGKYGLIQTELFDKPSKRPGILSYDINPEVPKDNINNLGGLQADEIWLAENHLLVLKGGGFSDRDTENTTWKPIDNYVAPKRQVKIPPKPKVAPPFPVQLKEGGPIEFIRGEKDSFRPLGPPPSLLSNVKTNLSSLPPAFSYPFPPFGLPPPPPYPFPGNLTDPDEDDPRFYYPPPYDFVYDKDNSSHVAPGPLVPGIVLPPPADFFAPLVSPAKRPVSKPGKRPTENDRNKINHIGNAFVPKNTFVSKAKSVTTAFRPTSPVTETNDKEKVLPERKEKEGRKHVEPERKTTTTPLPMTRAPETTTKYSRVVTRPHETTAKVTPKTKAPKLSSGDWVPILGTSLCPPTDPKCYGLAPLKHDTRYNHVSSVFNSTEKPIEFATEINSVTGDGDFYPINGPRPNYYTSTASPYYDLKPIIVPTTVTTASYKSVDSDSYDAGETYYIYEEPIAPGTKVILRDFETPEIRNGPTIVYVNHDVRPKFEIDTVSPLQASRDRTVKKPRAKVKNKPSPLELFENELSTITNSNRFSISYTVGDGQPEADRIAGYSYGVPLDDPSDNIIKNSHRNNYKNKKGRSKEVKTPVFEYSFSAPGYGQGDSPKISSVIPTTEKPNRHAQFSYFGFDSGLPAEAYSERNTQSPIQYTSQKAKFRKVLLNQFGEFLATEAPPYTQLYTRQQDPEFLDDITKNYFTLFGKKINPDAYSKYVTTPLPPPADRNKNGYYEGVKNRQRAPKGPKRQNIRFPEEAAATSQNANDQKDQGYDVRVAGPNGNPPPRPLVSKPDNYNNGYYNYRAEYYHRDYSLASDINVNYRKPYPPIDPEAEYIDSSYVRGENPPTNSYISYRLPGNGGHFYFLTPQNIHATNYHLASSGVRFPRGYNRLYYKRNARIPRTRRWARKK